MGNIGLLSDMGPMHVNLSYLFVKYGANIYMNDIEVIIYVYVIL